MDKQAILKTIKELREKSPKRNFSQSFDLIINLQQYDLKKNGQIDKFVVLPYAKGKKVTVCGLVDKELEDSAKVAFNNVIHKNDFTKYAADKKAVKNLANQYDFFVAQANIMTNIAASFGRVFGPKGKMPNPKAECVVAPNANLKTLYEKLQKTVRIKAIKELSLKTSIGTEAMKDEEIAENVLAVYNVIVHSLPAEKQNIKEVCLKLTMSPVYAIKEEVISKEDKKGKKK
jgi:large subunit ribosomal protein L1